jgi:hypothetical protein
MTRRADEHEGTAEEISEAAAANGDAPLPVIAEVRPIEPARPAAPAAVQAAAVAATGFVAGAATFAVVKRARGRAAAAPRRRKAAKRAKAMPFGEVVASRSFLVDVHLLNRD